MIALVFGIGSGNLKRLTSQPPNLEIKTLHDRSDFLQPDEFRMEWDSIWDAYFESKDEFDDFMSWVIKNACKPPKKIAVELNPYNLLVCAKPCKPGFVSVLMFKRNGKRVRACKRIPPAPPAPPAPPPVSF